VVLISYAIFVHDFCCFKCRIRRKSRFGIDSAFQDQLRLSLFLMPLYIAGQERTEGWIELYELIRNLRKAIDHEQVFAACNHHHGCYDNTAAVAVMPTNPDSPL